MTEILEELPRLDDDARQIILRRLIELDAGLEIEETPEMLAAPPLMRASARSRPVPGYPWRKPGGGLRDG